MEAAARLKKRKKSDIVKERKLFRRCGECINCLKAECGSCKHCLDMPKFGGSYKLKKACVGRECVVAQRSREDPITRKIVQKDKMKILNNTLSVTFDNGKIVRYRSGEKMHNGKLLIISHKENKGTFLSKVVGSTMMSSTVRPDSPPPKVIKPEPNESSTVDLDIDEFVNKYLQVYYEDRSLGALDDMADDRMEEFGDSVIADIKSQQVEDLCEKDERIDLFDMGLRFGDLGDFRWRENGVLELGLDLLGGIGALGDLQDVGSNLAKEFCHLCTFNSKCGNCILNTALKEIGNTVL